MCGRIDACVRLSNREVMQKFSCTQCGKVLKVSSKLIGKKGRCPKCGIKISFVEEDAQSPVVKLKMDQSGLIERPQTRALKPVPVQTLPQQRTQPTKARVIEASYRAAPVYRPIKKKRSWPAAIAIALGILTLAGVGFQFAFPKEAKSIWAKIAGGDAEKPVFSSLELEVEKEAFEIIEKIWEDFPELDEGKLQYEDGFVVINQTGHNELDAQVGRLIEEELRNNVEDHEFVKHIDYLQGVLAKLDDKGSPLHLISGLSKVSAKSRVQEEIFKIAIDAWEDNFSRQKKKIDKLSSSLIETKIHEYIGLKKQIREKTEELVDHSKPSESTKFGDELFAVMKNDLASKFETSSATLYNSVFKLIQFELRHKDKSKNARSKVAGYFELYDAFVTKNKTWDDETSAFVTLEIEKLSADQQMKRKLRDGRIVMEIKAILADLSDEESKVTVDELVKEYPDSKSLAARLGFSQATDSTISSSVPSNNPIANSFSSPRDSSGFGTSSGANSSAAVGTSTESAKKTTTDSSTNTASKDASSSGATGKKTGLGRLFGGGSGSADSAGTKNKN